jgi:hypothetical protein
MTKLHIDYYHAYFIESETIGRKFVTITPYHPSTDVDVFFDAIRDTLDWTPDKGAIGVQLLPKYDILLDPTTHTYKQVVDIMDYSEATEGHPGHPHEYGDS